MRLSDVMTTEVITIDPDASANDAWRLMQRHRIRHLVVTEGKRVIGVISERDLGGREGATLRRGRSVRELLTPQIATAAPGTTLRQAANLMRGRLIGSLPVIEKGRVVGIVTATDVLEELGRGATRPTTRAQRRDMRLPPAAARRAAAKTTERSTRRGAREVRARGASARGKSARLDGDGRAPATARRTRQPKADSAKRAPLAAPLPRPAKRVAGRTPAALTPVHIRAQPPLDEASADYLRRKLGRKLGKFAPSIERASVRIDDVNGPKGGIDKRCRIKAVVSGLPSVVVEERHEALRAAMDRAMNRIERAVRKQVQRRRTVPMRVRAHEGMALAR